MRLGVARILRSKQVEVPHQHGLIHLRDVLSSRVVTASCDGAKHPCLAQVLQHRARAAGFFTVSVSRVIETANYIAKNVLDENSPRQRSPRRPADSFAPLARPMVHSAFYSAGLAANRPRSHDVRRADGAQTIIQCRAQRSLPSTHPDSEGFSQSATKLTITHHEEATITYHPWHLLASAEILNLIALPCKIGGAM